MAEPENPTRQQIGRLAFRHEGEWWNAYFARPDTMDGALPLGSIRMSAVARLPAVKDGFMDLMRQVVGELIRSQTGNAVAWPDGPRLAPEHERAGHV